MEATERAAIMLECMRLQTLYGVTADRNDVDGFTALFAPHGSITIPEAPIFVGHEAIRAAMQALADRGTTMRHVVTNQLIDVVDARRATGRSYLIVFDNPDPADEAGLRDVRPPSTVGDCDDVFVLTEEGWKFESHRLRRVFRPLGTTA